MNFQNALFLKSAVFMNQCPNDNVCEIALLGRSNVGKSSFINCICQNKKLAKTSKTPGKTSLINFYSIDKAIRIVDLPGYGYAKVSKVEKNKWAKMIETFLETRKNLIGVFLILDIRHTSNDDKIMFDWIKNSKYCIVIIATKTDKILKTKLNLIAEDIKREFKLDEDSKLFLVSSKTKVGTDEIKKFIESFCLRNKKF
ncbi:MAG: ribosome biogenesis GTP-binding protein YihA/YsxC [Clostridiales bacterium]|jgi:GTP-binding protein|nr:ribosome biogenesis GTP-binding protein YihA/YsxC [Clostridiales bacterium]